MADTVVSTPAPRKRHGWLRALGWVLASLLVLVIVAYFVLTSSAFFKGVILPKVSVALNAKVTVSDASIHPFSQVILHDFRVQTAGADPLFAAPEVRLRYSLMDIIGGNIHVDEIAVSSPTILVVENPDGTSNLDPILKAQKSKPAETKPAQPAKPSKPAQIDIRKLAFTDATLRNVKLYAGGKQDVAEISHLNVNLENLKNGQAGKLSVSADLSVNNNPPAPGAAGLLQAKLNGSFDLSLSADLKPALVKGNTRLEVTRAEGALAQANTFAASLDCDLTPTEIKQLALRFQKASDNLGEIVASGPFDIEKSEGHVNVVVSHIDKKLLNLASAAGGLDFGPTTIDSTNEIVLTRAGDQITVNGRFNLNQFQITRAGDTTPPLDLYAAYGLTSDRAAGSTVLNVFTLDGNQRGKSLLHGQLSSPMILAAGSGGGGVGDSTLKVALTELNLADWRPFAGDPSLGGDVSMNLELTSQQSGKQTTVNLNSQLHDITASTGNVHIAQMTLSGSVKDNTPDFKQHNVAGTLALSDFSGQVGSNSFRNFGATADLDLTKTPESVHIRKISGKVTRGQDAGGTFDLSGDYGLSNKTAQLTARLADFNQNGLGTFLQPMLADKKLVSVALNANASVQCDPQAGSSVKAQLQITNLVVSDPKQQFPATPLAAGLLADASWSKQVADVRQLQLSLTPTARATNQVQLSGHFDLSQTNGISGNLKLVADSLDLTSYYDLFGGQSKTAAGQPAPGAPKPAPTSAAAAPETEPAPIQLPLRDFTAEASIHRLYLHEVEVADWQTIAKLDAGHVVLNPCKLALNGAPVSALVDLDLSVPGFKYDVTFNATAVPLAPLVNTFQPEHKGILSGTFTAQTKIAGAGVTGASLQKHLSGKFDLTSTSLNLAIANVQNKYLKPLLTVITQIPDLVQNPLGKGTALLGGLTGVTHASTNDISKSPIEAIIAHGDMGAGKINLNQALIQSPAFEAEAKGAITLAPVLTNSTLQIPVTVSLLRSVAQAIYLANPDSPTNSAYVQLPPFLTETGTLGAPQATTDKAVLGKVALQIATQAAGNKNMFGQSLQKLQGLTGGNNAGTNAPGANTNQPGGSLNGLLQGLGNSLRGSNAVPSPAGHPPATNQAPANNLLNNLFGPKK